MKQHITIEQLNELTLEQRMKLGRWLFPHPQVFTHEIPLLSIGQIIEFLQDHEYFEENCDLIGEPLHTVCNLNWEFNEELCDALWSAVKETL